MKQLNAHLLKKFLKTASLKLTGEWLLVGGTLLPAVGIDIRATLDIDIIGLGKKEKQQSLELMEIAESLGLSIESINQAADFFLNRLKYTKADLIPLIEGKRCTIYRPSCFLYIKLKSLRLTETDLSDCLSYFDFCVTRDKNLDPAMIIKYLEQFKSHQDSDIKKFNLQKLIEEIGIRS